MRHGRPDVTNRWGKYDVVRRYLTLMKGEWQACCDVKYHGVRAVS